MDINNPNGLYAEEKALLVGIYGKVLKINYHDKNVASYIANTGPVDGLKNYKKDYYIVSDWVGRTQLVSRVNDPVTLIDSRDNSINSADIEVIKSKKMLLVPTFSDNRVIAYRLNF